MNLPKITGPIVLTEQMPQGHRSRWTGRWQLKVDGWHITLDSRPDHTDVTSEARHKRLYVLTHAMEIRRADNEDFTVDQANSLLEQLRITFSFAFGYWTAPVLPRGYDKDDRVVWERWAAPICEPYRRTASAWLYPGRPEDLTELARRAIPALADRSRRGATRLQMQLAVSSVESGFVEQRILTAAPAVENLSWVRLVVRPQSSQRTHRGWTRDEYKNHTAEDRLRYLLQEACIPTDIDPMQFPALAAFTARDRTDGPTAVTRIRNRLVHPKSAYELSEHHGQIEEAWLLQRRYLTLLILHDIGYRGGVVDPMNRVAWDAHPVPWLAGSVNPSMPLGGNANRPRRPGRA